MLGRPQQTLSRVSMPGGLTERGEAPPVGAYYYYSTRTTTTTTNPAGAVLGTDGAWQLLSGRQLSAPPPLIIGQLAPLQITSHNRQRVTFPRHISDIHTEAFTRSITGAGSRCPSEHSKNCTQRRNILLATVVTNSWITWAFCYICVLYVYGHGIYSYVTFERYHRVSEF